jgi:hypothetical protein
MSTLTNQFPFVLRKIGDDKYLDSHQLLIDLLEYGFEFSVEEELLFSKLRCDLDEKEAKIIDNFEGVKFTLDSMTISGFVFTKEEIDDHKRLAFGEVTTEELLQKTIREIEELKITNPEYFAPEATKN